MYGVSHLGIADILCIVTHISRAHLTVANVGWFGGSPVNLNRTPVVGVAGGGCDHPFSGAALPVADLTHFAHLWNIGSNPLACRLWWDLYRFWERSPSFLRHTESPNVQISIGPCGYVLRWQGEEAGVKHGPLICKRSWMLEKIEAGRKRTKLWNRSHQSAEEEKE